MSTALPRSPIITLLLAGTAGALFPLATAPWDFWPLALISIALLLTVLRQASPRRAFWLGWLYGSGLFGVGASWVYVSIHDYGYAPVALAALLTGVFCIGLGLFFALLCWTWSRWLRAAPGSDTLGFAALWTLFEWLRVWVLTGFPWLFAGYSQIDAPLRGWAPLTGVIGLSFLVVLSASLLLKLNRHPQRWATVGGLLILIWGGGGLLERVEWAHPRGDRLQVAMVQANIAQERKWNPDYLQQTLIQYAEMSAPLWGTDLIVWPEAALPAYRDRIDVFLNSAEQIAQENGSSLITGVPTRVAAPERPSGSAARNSLLLLGEASAEYHKRHLVPFGEYVPLESILRGLIRFFDLPMSSFVPGPDTAVLFPVGQHQLAPSICYEIVYPDLIAETSADANALITVSNDTWFGRSAGPLQHLQMARMRALENARPLIRSTNNGVSALIDHRGKILTQGEQFTREVVRGSIQPMMGTTAFAQTGSVPVLLISALIVLLTARRSR